MTYQVKVPAIKPTSLSLIPGINKLEVEKEFHRCPLISTHAVVSDGTCTEIKREREGERKERWKGGLATMKQVY